VTATHDSSALMPNVQAARDPLTSHAYFEKTSAAATHHVSVHAGMLKIYAPQSRELSDLPSIGGQRGAVKGFSRASRKRMIEMMSCVRAAGSLMFVTITYPDIFPLDASTWHRHFEAFRDRFEYHYANWRAIWRIELIDRKSGENSGVIAPHWHLIIFTPAADEKTLDAVAEVTQTELRQMWYEIVASGDENHLLHGVDVAPVRSIRHAMSYVSKYVAKQSGDILEIGRRWGRIGKFDTSESIKVSLTFDEFLTFKRLVRSWMRKRRGKFTRRFARQSPLKGCAVFGMGDDTETDWHAFIFEAFRQVADLRQRERGIGQ